MRFLHNFLSGRSRVWILQVDKEKHPCTKSCDTSRSGSWSTRPVQRCPDTRGWFAPCQVSDSLAQTEGTAGESSKDAPVADGLQPSRGAQLNPWAIAAVPQAGWARCRGAVRTGGQAAEGTLLLTLPLLERIAQALCSQMLATVSSTSSSIIAFSIPRKPWDRHRYLIIIVNPTQSSTQNYLL